MLGYNKKGNKVFILRKKKNAILWLNTRKNSSKRKNCWRQIRVNFMFMKLIFSCAQLTWIETAFKTLEKDSGTKKEIQFICQPAVGLYFCRCCLWQSKAKKIGENKTQVKNTGAYAHRCGKRELHTRHYTREHKHMFFVYDIPIAICGIETHLPANQPNEINNEKPFDIRFETMFSLCNTQAIAIAVLRVENNIVCGKRNEINTVAFIVFFSLSIVQGTSGVYTAREQSSWWMNSAWN